MLENKPCRWCRAKALIEEVTFEEMPLTDEFVKESDIGKEYLADIQICICQNCGLIQNPNDFSFSRYYEDYNYSSGHSEFVQIFMQNFAEYLTEKYQELFNCLPSNVLEVGSGDGVQLREFQKLGIQALGIEPSEHLQNEANKNQITTLKEYFDENTIYNTLKDRKYSITLSSFTLDHIPDPKTFLNHLWQISADNSITAFEIHDVTKINDRGEWCLFEHEHMIYTDENFWKRNLIECGFEFIEANPLPDKIVRANSLLVIGRKVDKRSSVNQTSTVQRLKIDKAKIHSVQKKLEEFLSTHNNSIIGWGLGGRGVMTAALLKNSSNIVAFFDTNFKECGHVTPKTHIKIENMSNLNNYCESSVIIFSFGYFDEICKNLLKNGFKRKNIFSLLEFF